MFFIDSSDIFARASLRVLARFKCIYLSASRVITVKIKWEGPSSDREGIYFFVINFYTHIVIFYVSPYSMFVQSYVTDQLMMNCIFANN